MAVYKAPLKDIQFVMNEVLDVSSLSKLPGYRKSSRYTIGPATPLTRGEPAKFFAAYCRRA